MKRSHTSVNLLVCADKRRKGKGAAGGGDGNMSDWGPNANGPAAAAEWRKEVQLLKEGLKLMSAEVAFRCVCLWFRVVWYLLVSPYGVQGSAGCAS
jgi:hypothetical protein